MKELLKSFLYAFKGIAIAFTTERNLKIQTAVGFGMVTAGFYFHISTIEWCILLLTIGLVLSLELVNTAIEKAVDLVTKERYPLAGMIKDIAAGAVLLVSAVAVLIGIILFWKYVF